VYDLPAGSQPKAPLFYGIAASGRLPLGDDGAREGLLDNNRRWVAPMTEADPHFFAKRVGKQEPHFLFIGCSDSESPPRR